MNESPQNKLKKIEKRFQDLQNGAEEKDKLELTPKEKEQKAESILIELDQLIYEVEELEIRRLQSLQKQDLTSDENYELGLLNEIAEDLQNLEMMMFDFMDGNKISPERILKTKNPKLIIASKERFKWSDRDVLMVIYDYGIDLNNPRLECLRNLQIPDETVATYLSPKKYRDYFRKDLTYIFLKYCNLNEKQKMITLNSLLSFRPTEKVVLLLLSNLDLPLNIQEKIIKKLEDYTKLLLKKQKTLTDSEVGGLFGEEQAVTRDFGFADFVGLFRQDLLESQYLPKALKKRIAKLLVLMGSGLDCKYLLMKHPEYIDENLKKSALKRINESPATSTLKIPDFYQATKEQLKGKKVQFIVHPFFNCTTDNLIAAMKKALEEKDSMTYLEAYHGYKEYERYKKLKDQKDTITVFLLPKRVTKGDEAVFKGINETVGKSENVFYLETYHNNSGILKEGDIGFLSNILPEDAEISASGSYIDRCLRSSIKGLTQIKPFRKITEVYSLSVYDPFDSYIDMKKIKFPLKTDEIKSIEDVTKIIDANSEENAKYEKAAFGFIMTNRRKYGAETPIMQKIFDKGEPESKISHEL